MGCKAQLSKRPISSSSPSGSLSPLSPSYPLCSLHLASPKRNGSGVPLNQAKPDGQDFAAAASSSPRRRRNGYGHRSLRVPLLRLRQGQAAPRQRRAARPATAARRRGPVGAVRAEREAEEAAALRARPPRAAIHVRRRRALRPRTNPHLSFSLPYTFFSFSVQKMNSNATFLG